MILNVAIEGGGGAQSAYFCFVTVNIVSYELDVHRAVHRNII